MKTLHQLLPAPLILFSLSFFPFIAFSIREFPLPPVVSLDRKEVKLGEPYYIASILSPTIGVCLVDNVKCPKDIIKCPFFSDDPFGLPITFSPVDNSTEDTVVRENTPYLIQLSVPGNCSDENFWYLKDDGIAGKNFVAIGPKTLAVEFIIQKVFVGYKITGCVLPSLPICYGLGIVWESDLERLGIGSDVQAVEFVFDKATTNSSRPLPSPSATS